MATPRIYNVLPCEKRRAKHGEAVKYLEDALLYEGDDCLIWPFARKPNGYSHVNIGGVDLYVHREICCRMNGSPIGDRNYAAHECGNGHLGCITPKHLSWKTSKENNADMLRHGTRLYGEQKPAAKLTEAQVRQIKSRRNELRPALAKEFGVSNACIHMILNGVNWAWV